jgi:hypothetical protein
MKKDSPGNKRPYSFPSVSELNLEQAKHFVAEHANCSDQEAMAMLESLCRELQEQK